MSVTYNMVAAETVPAITRQNANNSNFVTALGIQKPENAEFFIKRFGNQMIKGLGAIAEIVGAKEATTQQEYSHWEENRIVESLSIVPKSPATALPTSGQTATVFTVSQKNGQDNNYLREGDVIRFAVGDFIAVVTAVSGQDITAIPYGTWKFPAATASTAAILQNREAKEGGTTPSDSILPKPWKYTNSVQIIDEVFNTTGSAATDMIWFKVTGANGEDLGYSWSNKGAADTDVRFHNYKEQLFMLGEQATADTKTAGYVGTRGLIEDIKSYGIQGSTGDAITLSFIDALTLQFEKNRAGREFAWLAGFNQRKDISDMIASLNNVSIGGSSFGSFSNSESMFLTLDFEGFQRNGYKFAVRNFEMFNIEGGLGTAGFDYMDRGVVVPMDSVKNPADRAQVYKSFNIRYKAMGGYSREMETWNTGAANGTYTNKTDKLEINYRSECGFEAFGLNRYAYITK